MDYFRPSMQTNLSLCQYNVQAFTRAEIDAIEEYDDRVTLTGHFDPETLLEGNADPAGALRERAEELTRWHEALVRLLTDSRLEPPAAPDPYTTPAGPAPQYDPYSPAVSRFLRAAAADYHRHRQGFEYAVTVWALGLQAPVSYPPESRHIDLDNRALKLWN
ncbi:hypothetical protein [Streptomyces syringium]|uniref:hypothetical protein n=1 Tax=Streptomyces syringium TaxID=76729 RepID=UPI003AACE050